MTFDSGAAGLLGGRGADDILGEVEHVRETFKILAKASAHTSASMPPNNIADAFSSLYGLFQKAAEALSRITPEDLEKMLVVARQIEAGGAVMERHREALRELAR